MTRRPWNLVTAQRREKTRRIHEALRARAKRTAPGRAATSKGPLDTTAENNKKSEGEWARKEREYLERMQSRKATTEVSVAAAAAADLYSTPAEGLPLEQHHHHQQQQPSRRRSSGDGAAHRPSEAE